MKKTLFTMLALVAAMGVKAQITTIPYTADFEESAAPFDAGSVLAATDIGNVLQVCNTTATAAFAVDGSDAYAIASNEEITIQFDGLHGWAGDNSTSTIQLVNSEGVVLVGYTYSRTSTSVTDVVLGGQTASGFEAFFGQANYSDAKSKGSANGFTHGQHYSTVENRTPKLTFKVHGLGAVSFNMMYKPANKAIQDITYAANLEGVKMDLAKIVIIDNCANTDRCIGIDNLSITTAEKYLYKYTINYVDENEKVVKTKASAAEEGTIVAIDETVVWADGVKYYVESNNSSENAVDKSNATVITVKVKQAATYKYTVVATDGTNELCTLADKAYYEGENVDYAYPRYINVDGTLYRRDADNGVYNGTFLLDADGKKVEAVYTVTEVTNVMFFKEAEDIKGLEVCNTGTVADRCSYRAGAFAKEDALIVRLTPGTYNLLTAAYGGEYSFKVNGTEVLNMANAGSWREANADFTLTEEENELTFVGGSGTAGSLDFVVLQSEDGAILKYTTRWDFTKWSDATIENLKADAAASSLEGWSDIEKVKDAEAGNPAPEATADKCFWLTNAEGGDLKANGVLIEELKGLIFGATYSNNRSLAIAVDYPSTSLGDYAGPQYLWLGGGGKKMACFTIPNVKVGEDITMVVESHKPSDARGVELYVGSVAPENKIGESFKPTTQASYTWSGWTLPENVDDSEAVDIIVYNTSGCHIYSIECTQTEKYVPTSVSEVKAQAPASDAIYNLNGQRVMKATKGLYIVNGKKVFVK